MPFSARSARPITSTLAIPLRVRLFVPFSHPLRSSDHTFPAALIVIASTERGPNTIDTLQRLYQPQNPPPPFDKGYMDPSIPKYYVVLHDVARGNNEAYAAHY